MVWRLGRVAGGFSSLPLDFAKEVEGAFFAPVSEVLGKAVGGAAFFGSTLFGFGMDGSGAFFPGAAGGSRSTLAFCSARALCLLFGGPFRAEGILAFPGVGRSPALDRSLQRRMICCISVTAISRLVTLQSAGPYLLSTRSTAAWRKGLPRSSCRVGRRDGSFCKHPCTNCFHSFEYTLGSCGACAFVIFDMRPCRVLRAFPASRYNACSDGKISGSMLGAG